MSRPLALLRAFPAPVLALAVVLAGAVPAAEPESTGPPSTRFT